VGEHGVAAIAALAGDVKVVRALRCVAHERSQRVLADAHR
jgi:hypothetical protein